MMLAVEGVTFGYRSAPVLQDVSFTVQPGEFLAVLGNNGAGKSTLLRCITRIVRPQAGTVLLGEDDVHLMSGTERARRIGHVPQRAEASHMTVYDTVLVGRTPHITWSASHRDHHVVEDVLAELGLEHLAMRPIDELSGGELQKTIIARALAQEPRVLLLDEPTSSLDLRNQLDVLDTVKRVTSAQGVAVIAVMHDLNLALRFADAFLLLSDGRVHACGGPEVLTPESIAEVYGVPVALAEVDGVPVVVPL
ncbi:MAG: ABC transporter ATP-binding protein [Coriobacteriia bacterium]|nr:ABC transporter ATP-binding protein [Coriobacteriia bacterium]MBN2848949.1 ABC transporter ATP-binding protein [Coriobacteriia bacterium]